MTIAQKLRMRFCAVAVLAVMLVGFVVVTCRALLRPVVDVDDAVIAQIYLGMSQTEALQIMGIPPGDYTTRRVHNFGQTVIGPQPPPPRGIAKVWDFNSKSVIIYFADGKVEHIVRCQCEPAGPWIEDVWRHIVEFCKGL